MRTLTIFESDTGIKRPVILLLYNDTIDMSVEIAALSENIDDCGPASKVLAVGEARIQM